MYSDASLAFRTYLDEKNNQGASEANDKMIALAKFSDSLLDASNFLPLSLASPDPMTIPFYPYY